MKLQIVSDPLFVYDVVTSCHFFRSKDENVYFGNCDMYDLLHRADVWICGHSHESFNVLFDQSTRVLCNAYGYVDECTSRLAMIYVV